MASLEHGLPLSPESLSETGSVAKQFTAAVATLRAVRGRLSLDDSMGQHLPEMPGFTRDITVEVSPPGPTWPTRTIIRWTNDRSEQGAGVQDGGGNA